VLVLKEKLKEGVREREALEAQVSLLTLLVQKSKY
jgi:hypothetical protein